MVAHPTPPTPGMVQGPQRLSFDSTTSTPPASALVAVVVVVVVVVV